MLVLEPLGFLGAIGDNAFALVAEREIDGGGDFFADGGVPFDLPADRFDGGVRSQKAHGQSLIFAQQAEEQMFGLDIKAAELAGFIAGEKDGSPGLFGVALEHIRTLL
jgi:hypothetical protein